MNFDNYVNTVDYKLSRQAWHEEERRLSEAFRLDALKDVGLAEHPKAEKAYNFAYSLGHSSGYSEILFYLNEIAQVLLDD